MKNITVTPNQKTEVTINHVSASSSGYGHKQISVEVFVNGEKATFKATTSHMPGYDEAVEIEDYDEKQYALYLLVETSINDQVAEWLEELQNQDAE